MSKNILIISDRFANGGLETHILTYANALKKENYNLFLLSNYENEHNYSIFEKRFNICFDDSDDVEKLLEHIGVIENIIKEQDIDIVHVHPFLSMIPAFFATQQAKIPLFVTLHGPLSVNHYHGQLYDFLLKILIFNYSNIIIVSKELKAISLSYGQNENFIYLPNPVDTVVFKNSKISEDIFKKWAIVSRLDYDKIEGIKSYLMFAIQNNVKKVEIFGDGDAKDILIQYIESLNSKTEIIFKGFSSKLDNELNEGYSIIGGMGRVVLEASSLNIPTLLIGYDGIKGLVDKELLLKASWSNFSGRGIKNISQDELTKEFEQLQIEKSKYLLREVVEDEFSIKYIFPKYMKFIQSSKFQIFPFLQEIEDIFKLSLDSNNPYLKDQDLLDRCMILMKNKFNTSSLLKNNLDNLEKEWIRDKIKKVNEENLMIKNDIFIKEQQMIEIKQHLIEKEQELIEKQNLILEKDNMIDLKNQELNSIYTSNLWKVASKYYALKEKPFMTPFVKVGRNLTKNGLIGTIQKSKGYVVKGTNYYKRHGFGSFVKKVGKKIVFIENIDSELKFNPYNFVQLMKPIKFLRYGVKDKIAFDFSVVMPVYNEEDNILKTLSSFSNQTLLPNEIVIVDGGSTDKTIQIIKNYQINNNKIKIILLETDYKNIGKQRNKGIVSSKNEIISLCDAGCIYDDNYFFNVIPYFSDSKDIDLVAAKYLAYADTVIGNEFIPNWGKLDLDNYLPGGASMTIKRSIAMDVGLFPEYLQNTGEDTYFSLMYRRKSNTWIFSDEAILYWITPKDREEAKEKKEKYGHGDGLNGLGCYLYPHRYNLSVDDLYGIGMKNGYEKRAPVEINEREIKGVVIILSGVPMTDSGGGQRGAQLACEFTKRNYKVFFINFYPSYEKENKIFFDIDYSLLELFSFSDFDVTKVYEKYLDVMETSYVISEIPHVDFLHIFELATTLKVRPTLIYDYIDNWNSSLGGEWYSLEIEEKFFDISDVLIASANSLQEELQVKSKRDVHLVPNAVNTTLFNPKIIYERPNDLPKNNLPIAIYIGAMWGEWFDWELIEYCFENEQNINFIFIGEAPKERIDKYLKYDNVSFLGLKKQYELPSYLQYSDCTLIPFKNDDIVKYVNPLKIYEYLAMYKPVIGIFYKEISHLPEVFLADSYEEFLEFIRQKSLDNLSFNRQKTQNFIDKNNWKSRVSYIFELNAREFN